MMHDLNAHAKTQRAPRWCFFAPFAPLREIFVPQHVIDPYIFFPKCSITHKHASFVAPSS